MTDAIILLARLLDLPPHLRDAVFLSDVEIVDGHVVYFEVHVDISLLPPGAMSVVEAALRVGDA